MFFCKSVNICKKIFLIFANFSVFIFKICKIKKKSVEGGKISAYTTYFFVHALLLQFINNIQSTGFRKKYSIPKKIIIIYTIYRCKISTMQIYIHVVQSDSHGIVALSFSGLDHEFTKHLHFTVVFSKDNQKNFLSCHKSSINFCNMLYFLKRHQHFTIHNFHICS